VVLDETAISEEYAAIKRRDEEQRTRPKPRSRRPKRAPRTRASTR
jgi:hypothetical protein